MWIESHQELGRHPKTKRLARALQISIPAAVGHLMFFWWWATDYAQSGNLDDFTDEDIADAAMWEGDAHNFADALISARFIDRDSESTQIHDWYEYAGKAIRRREEKGERNTPEYKIWRRRVLRRDNYTCVKCGKIGGELNAHHIERFRNNVNCRTDINNGITLCVDCHKQIHKEEGK
ncbi:hypothetical protein FACS1894216_05050 [Synergistales bacterium]|nr:hypothetical protein FACS1894216_05050 [Synergistales bacterium]